MMALDSFELDIINLSYASLEQMQRGISQLAQCVEQRSVLVL